MTTGTRCPNCGGMDYSEWGDMPCYCGVLEQEARQQQPTVEDLCGPDHAFYGPEMDPATMPDDVDSAEIGRCYCGQKRYLVNRKGELVER